MSNLICFGDVVKLSTKSAFSDSDADGACLAFLEQKKDMVLVVTPVKPELHEKCLDAEFIVSPVTKGDKVPLAGTPLNYKQPFVLKTSDGLGYSLNNKTPSASEVVSLQAHGVKGEMYVAVEKDGFGAETHVHDGDTNVELHVVDSNRIRKTYNNVPLRHVVKSKTDVPAGHVTCGAKGQVLTFKLVKLADRTETRKFIKDPVFRRASQLLQDAKADETSEASVLDSPSRAGSLVSAGSLLPEEPVATPPASPTAAAVTEAKAETPEGADATTTPIVSEAVVPVVETTPSPVHEVSAGHQHHVAVVDQVEVVDVTVTVATAAETVAVVEPQAAPVAVVAPSPVGEKLQTDLATIELGALSAAETLGSVPVHDKLSVESHAPVAAEAPTIIATDASELDTLGRLPSVNEDHVETACAGKCTIM